MYIKKILILFVVVGTLISCKKSSTRKIANDWNVDSMKKEVVFSLSNSSEVTLFENGSYSEISYENNQPVQTHYTGNVTAHELKINSDGSWTREVSYSRTTVVSQVPTTLMLKETETGTWDFAKRNKTDEFKKNEYVFFNLMTSNIEFYNQNSPSNVFQQSIDFEIGEDVKMYRIVESTKDELILELKEERKEIENSETVDDTQITTTFRLSKK
jgi:hypothetical protein